MWAPIFVVLFIFGALDQIRAWSASSLFFGSKNSTSDDEHKLPTRKVESRSLSSFDRAYSNRISIDQPVAKRGRRDIEASVKAHSWPSTIFSPLCEAWAYLDAESSIQRTHGGRMENNIPKVDDSIAWKYLDALVASGGIPSLDDWVSNVDSDKSYPWTFQNSSQIALNTALSLGLSQSLDENLLPLALALRAHMPHCEMHRSLARDAAISFGLYDITAAMIPPAAFCLLSRIRHSMDGQKKIVVLGTQVLLDASLFPAAFDAIGSIDANEPETEQSSLLLPLPDESYHPDSIQLEENGSDVTFVAILYGQVGTSAFATFYHELKQSGVKFVVRHMGHISYEEDTVVRKERHDYSEVDSLSSRAIPTSLQGYGVRLDIRNVEYKAFDDVRHDTATDGDSEPDWSDSGHHPEHPSRNEYLAGVNLKRILERLDAADMSPLPSDLQSVQTALLQSHPAQLSSESIVPPAWKRRSLSLQAATVIATSPDPLDALKGISQDLPSVAHSLSSVDVPDELKALAENATDSAAQVGAVSPGWGDAAFGFYVNSREVNVERPSFNVFQLFDVLREENKKLKDLEQKVRPVLKRAFEFLGKDDSVEWETLKSIRTARDIGLERLVQLTKSDLSSGESNDESDFPDEEATTTSSSKKYRIDVGRGGKKAIVYLNDIEKDPEYQSWPSSINEMMYRMQFGGGPTVRRNLFTMLIVIDPTSGNVHPAINIVGQLVNNQLPVRIGVLVVSQNDVLNGSPSQPGPWEFGHRPLHASDSLILLRHISKKYGGMVAISCLVNVFQPRSGKLPSVHDYIREHVSLLYQMGLVASEDEDDLRQEMERLIETSSSNDDGYEESFTYATKKQIRPGMSFINGIPLPDASDNSFGIGVNEILRFEQRHVMDLVMKGTITDTKPRSIYASLLSGDNLYQHYHPLLRVSDVQYLPFVSAFASELSLIVSRRDSVNLHEVEAIFVIEAWFDFDSSDGIEATVKFLELAEHPQETWRDVKTVSVAFRILSSMNPESEKSIALSRLFCVASRFDVEFLKTITTIIHTESSIADAKSRIANLNEFEEDTLSLLINTLETKSNCSESAKYPDAIRRQHYYTANGRAYSPAAGTLISEDDIKILLTVEMERNIAMTKFILPSILSQYQDEASLSDYDFSLHIHNVIGALSTVLNHIFSKSAATSSSSYPSARKARYRISEVMESLGASEEHNPLYFSWNDESKGGSLQVEVSVILDPLTEPTQRVAPLLLTIRDYLKLPLRVMIAPRQVVENDLPLSSYYRFTIDPLAVPDKNPPVALFSNLPNNHLLTVRMDVPEPWDVQQASAVQDADNLRCDPLYGCGDEAYILANKGGVEVTATSLSVPHRVESTKIDYTLKSLLFFGQCYDVKTSSPPNGLQLTLDRSKLANYSSKISANELVVEADGSITEVAPSYYNADKSSRDHTDTLVMKTVGYWQLRANPGVWNLKIAENSRGAAIYHMVEGSVAPSGRLLVSKASPGFVSKSLIMKDFSNHGQILLVKRNEGYETAKLFPEESDVKKTSLGGDEVVHVFSLATGHAYERLLKIMMLSVTKRTKSPVKFWLFENFLSPSFKESALYMADKIGCQLEFVTYKWPEWLRGQSEKQRLIWGYKILFLDVLFPLDVKKIIYVDADQVVRGDMTELWNLDLEGAPYGYTPFCDSREETLGYQFWRTGFWKNHLRGKPYHISALYVVDLERFRRELVGDKLRATYQQLSADPNSLANLDQDLPNYAQHDVRIFSLPQKWLWCESWCSDETKAEAMTIDLCNNPEHKEAKITMAKRIISGDLFEESWEELDAQVERYYQEFLSASLQVEANN